MPADAQTHAASGVVASATAVSDSVAAEVSGIVAKVLGRDVATVKAKHNLVDELGAESLDFLDIVFELEDRFDIEITRGAFERVARGDMTEEEFAPDGVISSLGLERLRLLLPESAERITDGLRPREILGLFTVMTFARMVVAVAEHNAERVATEVAPEHNA